ncbi:hypothetical protein [Occallatibacter savannae]|uniref:hypothetical protein n=1 Tax=Occallatibacter savannae TaxID=1002691 RepID=UPI000D6A023A|nr:hypothetical protein [Occallatibacter savannae]
MEADWEFEIGVGAPVIEARWSGFVDLRAHPERVSELSECRDLPGLAEALVRLNASGSPVWTSKTDVFPPEHIDADEIDASAEEAASAIACYIDMLPSDGSAWGNAHAAEQTCRKLCASLRIIPLSRCRVDVVARRAMLGDAEGLGATVYFTACGEASSDANVRLGACLNAFVDNLLSLNFASRS